MSMVPELVVPWPKSFVKMSRRRRFDWVDRRVHGMLDELQEPDAVQRSFSLLSASPVRSSLEDVKQVVVDWPWVSNAWCHAAGIPLVVQANYARNAMIARPAMPCWIEWDKNAGHFRILREDAEPMGIQYWIAGESRKRKLVATVGPDEALLHERISNEQHLAWLAAATGRDVEAIREVQGEDVYHGPPNAFWDNFLENVT